MAKSNRSISFSFESLNEHGNGSKFRISLYPSLPDRCDFDLAHIFDYEEVSENSAGVLLTHSDLEQLRDVINQAIDASYAYKFEDDEELDDDFEFDWEED